MTRDTLFKAIYGSHLYGSSTPTSDQDFKEIYLPSLDSLLLAHKPKIFKKRFDVAGNPIAEGETMPANGSETEFIPFQTFVRDFVAGQTYAVEVAFAYIQDRNNKDKFMNELMQELVQKFITSEVHSMVGFARKQTLDYVHRGKRLNEAVKIRKVLQEHLNFFGAPGLQVRLDVPLTFMTNGVLIQSTVLDEVAKETGLKIGSSVNSNKTLRTLELNGRSYLETTELGHLIAQLDKLIVQYGERSTAAAQTDVDHKSLSHALRVYQQSIELLETGKITFPRANAEYLLSVKQGKISPEFIKNELEYLDTRIQELLQTSTVQKRTTELEAAAENWLLEQLNKLYYPKVLCEYD